MIRGDGYGRLDVECCVACVLFGSSAVLPPPGGIRSLRRNERANDQTYSYVEIKDCPKSFGHYHRIYNTSRLH